MIGCLICSVGWGTPAKAKPGVTQLPDPGPTALRRFEATHVAMGVEFKAAVLAADKVAADAAFRAGWETVDRLDALLSDYRSDSAAMRLAGSAPHREAVEVAPELWSILSLSLEISRETSGAFDVTVGPASHLWRAAIKRNRLPEPELVAEARNRIGWQRIGLEAGNRVTLDTAGMVLDFGGIGQGYAADMMLSVLREQGIHSALIDVSGDIAVAGFADGKSVPWRIALPPASDGAESPMLELTSGGVASSGSSRQFIELDGVRYSHLVDPRSGHAMTSTRIVTVEAPTAALADALATAFSILPKEAIASTASRWLGVRFWIVGE